jgi:hypothetical protein
MALFLPANVVRRWLHGVSMWDRKGSYAPEFAEDQLDNSMVFK